MSPTSIDRMILDSVERQLEAKFSLFRTQLEASRSVSAELQNSVDWYRQLYENQRYENQLLRSKLHEATNTTPPQNHCDENPKSSLNCGHKCKCTPFPQEHSYPKRFARYVWLRLQFQTPKCYECMGPATEFLIVGMICFCCKTICSN